MSVCVYVASRCSAKIAKWIELILAWSLPSTYLSLCYKEIQETPKIGILPSGSLSQTLDLKILQWQVGRRYVLSIKLTDGRTLGVY